MREWFSYLMKLDELQWTVLLIALLALLMLVLPTVLFLVTEWRIRKKRLTEMFSDKALRYYYETFQYVNVSTHFSGQMTPKRKFLTEYHKLDGKENYIFPVLLLLLTASAGVFACSKIVGDWVDDLGRTGQVSEASFVYAQAVAAFCGAYCWVLYDHLEHLRRWDFTAQDVYATAHRLFIAVPIGLALGYVFTDAMSVPGAFLIGAFPTRILRTYSKQLAERFLNIDRTPVEVHSRLLLLQSVGQQHEERFNDLGYLNVTQLAWVNPLELCIRTGYEINFIFEVVSEALMWVYVPTEMEKFRRCGVRSVYEVKCIYDDLNSKHERDRMQAECVCSELQNAMGYASVDTVKYLLWMMAADPHTEFIWMAWQRGDCDETNEALQ